MMRINLLILFLILIYIFINIHNKYLIKVNHEYFVNSFDINKIYVYPNFLTQNECNKIIKLASDRVKHSEVLCSTGTCKDTKWRTSSNTFINDYEDNICLKISKTVEKITNINKDYFEDLQVVKYETGQLYRPHWDACVGDQEMCDNFINHAGQRLATFIIYLNDNFEKGGTYFPKRKITIKPVTGKAILFFNLEKDNVTILDKSLHAGLPPSKGIKWMCNKWIRVKKFVN